MATSVGALLFPRRPYVADFMSGERAADEGDRSGGPPGDRGVQLAELGFGDVQPAGGNRRSQFDEDRPQVDLNREGMTGPAAGHDRHRDRPGQPVAAVTVEERLVRLIAPVAIVWSGSVSWAGLVQRRSCRADGGLAHRREPGHHEFASLRHAAGRDAGVAAADGGRLAFGAVAAVALALVAGLPARREPWNPLLQILRTLPLFGLIPVFIVWFGIGELPKIILIALGTGRSRCT